MHLLDSFRSRVTCIPTVHEVCAGIAAEYFNQVSRDEKAFALVTAGPGATNITTALAGAWLEHRELLVIGGQVKSTDLRSKGIRQRGIQEVDGISLCRPICKETLQIASPRPRQEVEEAIRSGRSGRPGPVFIEFCLDAQGALVTQDLTDWHTKEPFKESLETSIIHQIHEATRLLNAASRPAILIGAGVNREYGQSSGPQLDELDIPLLTTWHGADRISSTLKNYIGRIDTWGQRAANLIVNQADVVLAIGARLGLQETGFNWREFAKNAKVIHVDIDQTELDKGHPETHLKICGDATLVLDQVLGQLVKKPSEWVDYCNAIKANLPLNDSSNTTSAGYVSPYEFYERISQVAEEQDIWVPASSGGANSVAIQALQIRSGQSCVCDNGLASMGYGLPGAIGAAFGSQGRRVVLIEGDGGFAQNLQELATVSVNNLNIKMFLFCNDGYGSIRTTQRNYFGGSYLGCDTSTGLGFPVWEQLALAYGVEHVALTNLERDFDTLSTRLQENGPLLVEVRIDPEQTYWPKITSFLRSDGTMESNPLYKMTPELDKTLAELTMRYIK